MHNIMERYSNCKMEIKELSDNTNNKIWIALSSFLLSLLIVSGIVTLLINCLIFNDYIVLILVGLGICLYLVVILSRFFYYKTITKKQVKDMHIFYLVDSIIWAIAILVGVFIGLFI